MPDVATPTMDRPLAARAGGPPESTAAHGAVLAELPVGHPDAAWWLHCFWECPAWQEEFSEQDAISFEQKCEWAASSCLS